MREHDWQPRGHMTTNGKTLVLHACANCSIIKEFTAQEFWAKCRGVPLKNPNPRTAEEER